MSQFLNLKLNETKRKSVIFNNIPLKKNQLNPNLFKNEN